ncbi:MAG: bifunctional (p)ppGpp synthetase/guanosine-3',5'-bis(diphosphate) 3'-pyrophosphohydrolase ['Conium maculatum' witches'-broom phytoplasma]|nr:bifunctional (p)ppGpp synthetase/guanosine-3',5'-bis(diphosphate) 3'-pyrophosphohydrolase ['Conium maculatum' witches'-broom phytoplasma]
MLFNTAENHNIEKKVHEEVLFQELMQKVKKYIHEKTVLDKINQAYFLAKKKHTNQKRVTGEDFIIHPISVAIILADLNSEPNTLMAGLLHDSLEDTDLTFDELKDFLGEDVAYIVKRTTKLAKLSFNPKQRQVENHQKLFLAMANDIRVVLVKIADRLHNMQTLKEMKPEKQLRISQETLDIYVPLTHRLGLFQIKSQLEDLTFRYMNPKEYYRISNLINAKKNERENSIRNIIKNIKSLFYKSGITDFSISGRSKNIYSIYKKMNQGQVSFDEIFDLLAVRIIVDKVDVCYQCLGIIHAHYSPLPRRFKDYIAVPKPNLYQALHNTVLSKDGSIFEIQIKTKEMDEIAEKGIAAHWGYKENKFYSKDNKQLEIAQKLRWYQDLIKITKDTKNKSLQNSKTLVDSIKNDILSENVYVFTPKQEVFEFPEGSTPIDFAFRIHSMIGFTMTGAIVNEKIVPLDYKLKNGDIISIKTNKNVFRVHKDWLRIAKTSYVKKFIKNFLNKQKKEVLTLIQNGKEILEKELQAQKKDFKIDHNFVKKSFHKQSIQNVNELYEALGRKKITPDVVLAKITSFEEMRKEYNKEQISKNLKKFTYENETGVFIEGLDKTKLKLANCCNPIFGEEIVGFITKDKGTNVHRKDCVNLQQYDSNRLIIAHWHQNYQLKYATWLFIIGSYSSSLIANITDKANALGINISKINMINNNKLSETTIKLQILVKNISEMEKLISHLLQLSNIYQIYRGTN